MTGHSFIKIMACALIALGCATTTSNAEETKPQPINPQVKQFGPRVNKAPQAGAGQAMPNAQQAPDKNTEVIGKHGDWVVQCDKSTIASEDKKTQPRSCGMLQTASDPKNPNISLTLILLHGKTDGKATTMMRVMAPIGVFLPTGIALEIDGEAVGRVPFTRCLPQTCMAFAEASGPTLSKMKAGKDAKFIIYEGPGAGVDLPISLSGFTAAFTELVKQVP